MYENQFSFSIYIFDLQETDEGGIKMKDKREQRAKMQNPISKGKSVISQEMGKEKEILIINKKA